MSLLDRFLDAIKLNDDDDDYFDDDFEEEVEEKPKKRFFKDFDDDDDFYDDEEDDIPVKKSASSSSKKAEKVDTLSYNKTSKREKSSKKSKITPIKKNKTAAMEVNVIRPESMEDTKEIADTLLDNCTVILNLEGLDVDTAQRIIDFTCGTCYALGGALQKISAYIYIITPDSVDISGDYEELLNGNFDIPSMRSRY